MKSCSGSGSRPPCPCPEDWNEPWEAVELPRRTPGRPDSSGPVGCQSMGCMRSSKLEDGRSFHLRKRVHARAMKPIEAAITMMTVSVVRVILLLLEVAPEVEAPDEAEGWSVSEAVTILVAVWVDDGRVSVAESAVGVLGALVVTCELLEVEEGVALLEELGKDELEEAADEELDAALEDDADSDEVPVAEALRNMPSMISFQSSLPFFLYLQNRYQSWPKQCPRWPFQWWQKRSSCPSWRRTRPR